MRHTVKFIKQLISVPLAIALMGFIAPAVLSVVVPGAVSAAYAEATPSAAKKISKKKSTAKPTAKAAGKKSKKHKAARAAIVPDIDADGRPNLLSHAALVFDQATSRVIYAKNADAPAPIASITKLMTAMVVIEANPNMNEPVVIEAADIDTIKNSRSRLPVGTAFRREDLLRLALMASDNRAAAALARMHPGGTVAFVAAMNAKAKSLGLNNSHFVDPTGLAPGNIASPQDLAVMVSAASNFDLIRAFSTAPALNVTLPNTGRQIGFNNTNALVNSEGWNIGLSKTGFINEAGKCLVMQATIGTKSVVIVLMDSWGKFTRMGDANRIKKWIETRKEIPATPASMVLALPAKAM